MIIKRKHSGSFAVIPNAVSNDENLKADTLGVLVYLLAKPQDWKVSVADLRRRFHMGRNRVYEIIQELEAAAYVKRFQNRAAYGRFDDIEYHVFDCPQAVAAYGGAGGEPLPVPPLSENGDTVETQQNTVSLFTASPSTASRNQGRIYKTDLTKSLREENSANAGADTPQEGFEEKKPPIVEIPAIGEISPISQIQPIDGNRSEPSIGGLTTPSINQQVWNEGFDLLKATSLNPDRSIIGQWLKRASACKDGKDKLLAMIRAAVKAGTLDPVAYIAKAVNDEFGPLPLPKQFDALSWQRNIQAAIKTKDWPQAWGPAPGKKGCLVPTELITAQLTTALAGWKAAA